MKDLRAEATALKEALAEVTLENLRLRESMLGNEPWSAIGPRMMAGGDHE